PEAYRAIAPPRNVPVHVTKPTAPIPTAISNPRYPRRLQCGQNGQSRTLTILGLSMSGSKMAPMPGIDPISSRRTLGRLRNWKLSSLDAGRPWRAQWRGRSSAALRTAASIVTTRRPRLPPTRPPCADPFTVGAAAAATARTSYSPIDKGRGRTGGRHRRPRAGGARGRRGIMVGRARFRFTPEPAAREQRPVLTATRRPRGKDHQRP